MRIIVQITYKKIEIHDDNRLKRVLRNLHSFDNFNDFKLNYHEVLSNLSFGVDSDKFEEAFYKVGILLGFVCDRPDKRIKKGPDVLWGIGCGSFFTIECKNEVKEDRNTINKEEDLSQYDINSLTESTINDALNINKLDISSLKMKYSIDTIKQS